MSYCRWSSDNWKCDVYAFEASNGFNIHVASKRFKDEIPSLPDITKVSISEFVTAHQAQMDAIDKTSLVDIGGKYDGQIFVYDDLASFLTGLLDIQANGYNIPDWVFDNIREEIRNA